MPKFYCDYCDTFLTHDSPTVRKTHCLGRKHKDNVKFYYEKWADDKAQKMIDATAAMFKKVTKTSAGAAIPPPTLMPYGQVAPPNILPPTTGHPMDPNMQGYMRMPFQYQGPMGSGPPTMMPPGPGMAPPMVNCGPPLQFMRPQMGPIMNGPPNPMMNGPPNAMMDGPPIQMMRTMPS